MSDWDYAIVINRYISPFQLKNKIWPPENAIHIIYADEIPICAVIERKTKDDYLWLQCFISKGKIERQLNFLKCLLQIDNSDEMIFYNFAAALYNDGQYQKADSVLKKGLK